MRNGGRRRLFDSVFRLRLFDRLPLHVPGFIDAAMLEGLDVIDDVARTSAAGPAGRRAGVLTLKLSPGCRRSSDAPAGSAFACFALAAGSRSRPGTAVHPGARLPVACSDPGLATVTRAASVRACAGVERRERQNETNEQLHARVNAAEVPS